MSSNFYIVATPIGNLEDITYRAVRILSEVDIILCEDTRVTGKLLKHYGINTSMKSYHAQSSDAKEDAIVQAIKSGTTYALVSDAGTPTISDPGVKLIARIREDVPDISIVPVPGAAALVAGLSTTGFNGNQFTFYGFLPHKKGRKTIFDSIESDAEKISIFYESPHRLMKTLQELSLRFGETVRKICVARELTKLHESSIVGTANQVFQYYMENPDQVRGECVVIIDK